MCLQDTDHTDVVAPCIRMLSGCDTVPAVFPIPPSPLWPPWESCPRPSSISLTQTPGTLINKTFLILWLRKRRPPREHMTLERVPERILLPSVLSHPGCPPPHTAFLPLSCWVLSLWPGRVHSLF